MTTTEPNISPRKESRRTFIRSAGMVLGKAAFLGAGISSLSMIENKKKSSNIKADPEKSEIIDIHVHAHLARHPKISRPGGMQFPSPETLIKMMDDACISRAVLMSYVTPEGRFTHVIPEETLFICSQYPDRLIPSCCVDSRQLTNSTKADFMPMLSAYKELGCKLIGEYTTHIPFDDPLNLNLFSQVEETGLPVMFHLAPQMGGTHGCIEDMGLPRLENVLKRFPKLVFLGHSGPFWAEIGEIKNDEERKGAPKGRILKEGRVIELMRKYPNLHGDLSAGSGYNAISRDPEFGYRFMEEFKDRLHFGTDFARVPPNLPIILYFKKLKQNRLIPMEVYEKITYKNTKKLLQL